MFAKTIVLSDAFLDMPLSTRCLYFTLGMFADDDGFVNAPKGIMRQIGCSEDDMRVLLAKKFVIAFESGVIVIKHWRINNYLRNDRYNETKYKDEKSQLEIAENGAYRLGVPNNGIHSTEKDRLGKDSIEPQRAPAREEVQAYCKERGYTFSPDEFFDAYDATNWKIKGEPIYDWKAVAAAWDRKEREKTKPKYNRAVNGYEQSPIRESDIEGMIVNFD